MAWCRSVPLCRRRFGRLRGKQALKRELDINAENKSHLVHDTKYSSKATGTAATAPTAAAPAHELIRYVWLSDGAATDGTGGLN